MVISENCCNFIVLKYKDLQTIIAMITEDKVTELFCMADDFCKFFDAMMKKYTLKSDNKRAYHRRHSADPMSGMSERFQSGILNQVVFLGETSGIAARDNLSWKWHPAPLAGDLHEKGKRNILRARVI